MILNVCWLISFPKNNFQTPLDISFGGVYCKNVASDIVTVAGFQTGVITGMNDEKEENIFFARKL